MTDPFSNQFGKGRIPPAKRLVGDYKTKIVLALSAALFIGSFVYLSYRYQTFLLYGGDFGDYVHLFSTTVHGTGFLQQAKFRAGLSSYWGAHFAVTLLGLVPVFALFQTPYTLLAAQSLALATSVSVLWAAARSQLADDRVAGLVVVSYALNPYLWSAWGNGFYEQAVLPALVFGTYYAYRKRSFYAFLGGVALIALTNEFATLMLGGFLAGLALVAFRRNRLRSEGRLFVICFAIVVAVKFVSGVVISYFNDTPGIPMASLAAPLAPVIEGPRTTVTTLLGTVVSNPDLLMELFTLSLSGKVLGLFFVLIPVFFVAALDETTLGALAPFLIFGWLFAGKSGYYQFAGHYPLYVLPFLYVGLIRVFDRLSVTIPSRELFARMTILVLVISAGVGIVALQGPFGLGEIKAPGERNRLVDDAIDTVPRDATLVTQNDVYPLVSARPTARYVAAPAQFERYQEEHGVVRPDYILVDHHSKFWSQKLTEGFGDRLGTEYGRYRAEGEIVLWKRGYSGPVQPLSNTTATNAD
ncbi:DUF2079 domain-containing protein [Salinigranum rubrum]|uniref:DUF2079 domain-containing protein n=1 Tax=Salinigranum rubrum TaxID=755307 RepID=UPI0013A58380|nr:DUF2079 domain-containing protein [Salinigranum rubrum]